MKSTVNIEKKPIVENFTWNGHMIILWQDGFQDSYTTEKITPQGNSHWHDAGTPKRIKNVHLWWYLDSPVWSRDETTISEFYEKLWERFAEKH